MRTGFCSAGEEKWSDRKYTHFVIYYKNAPWESIDRVAESAEGYYDSLADTLGLRRFDFWTWDDRARIYIYDNAAEYRAATGQPEWSGGAAVPSAKAIFTFERSRDFRNNVLPHEMTHLILKELVGFNNSCMPRWFEEGVAVYQQRDKGANDLIIKEALKAKATIPLDKLAFVSLGEGTNPAGAQLFYAQAASLVDFLIRAYGKDKFGEFCKRLRDEKDFRGALRSVYSFSTMQELDEAWQKYIR
jgi:Peptidase MA superfamily